MTNVHFPAHKICLTKNEGKQILLAATGPCIRTLSFPDGRQLSTWPQDDVEESSDEEDEQEPPGKRQKLNHSEHASLRRQDSEASEASIEIVAEGQKRQKGERRRPKIPDLTLPNVSHLITTSDGRYAVAITAEDKAVRVYSISKRGRLRQKSSRCMPKKCCAIILSRDERTIMTADKFGDVYAIPLHPSSNYKPKSETPQVSEGYKPSATELTVHTKGNLDALKQQLLQKNKPSKREGPNFEHKLLLGHVSLLTDLVTAQGMVDGRSRPFVLTSDRDEHIRVSRGMPQTHVIHSFCLGHSEFVSKLCILPWNEQILVAGNGEPSLRIYEWQEGRQRSRLDLIETLQEDIGTVLSSGRAMDKLAVRGIWALSLQTSEKILLVALEGLPLLFSFQVSHFELIHMQTFKLEGNILDIVHSPGMDILAVSIDTIHKSGSFKEYRTEADENIPGIQFITMKGTEIIADEDTLKGAYLERCSSIGPWSVDAASYKPSTEQAGQGEADAKSKSYEKAYTPVGEFIYGLENLRKRRGKAAEDDEDEDGQGDDVGLDGTPEVT